MKHVLKNSNIEVCISNYGGVILSMSYKNNPVLRECHKYTQASDTACFPLVPFGNRMEKNKIVIDDAEYKFIKNTEDIFYLHGDGWLANWVWGYKSDIEAVQFYHHKDMFQYKAKQCFSLSEDQLRISLEVENTGDKPMICGLGWHPYFYRDTKIHVKAQCSHSWEEGENYLPINKKPCDFINGFIDNKWINTCYEGWDGTCCIESDHYKVELSTFPALKYFHLFSMDNSDFFCFEPMSHQTNGFYNWEKLGFVKLNPKEKSTQELLLKFI